VRQVLEDEAEAIGEPGLSECQRVYDASKAAFMTPELYEASHLLCAPQSDDASAWDAARAKAEQLLAAIEGGAPFADLARRHSDCPTASEAGLLGQLTRGDLAPELEEVLLALKDGETASAPVRTRHGWHLVRLERRAPSRVLPFEVALPAIRAPSARAARGGGASALRCAARRRRRD
jgi:peptidyl-prolyl cis-trans isomerase C